MSRNYTLDEDTYPTFLHDDGKDMDLLAFIHVADPTKVKVGEREHTEEEARLLDSTVGRVVLLLPIAPDHADSELEASVEKLFDESGGADQGDSAAAAGGQETKAEIVAGVRFVDEKNVVAEKPKHPRKKRQAVTDASGSSHPLKKAIERSWNFNSILNVESGVEDVATLPFVTSFVSTTPEHDSGVPADSITGLNHCTIGASERSAVVPPVMTEAVITTHVASIPSVTAQESGTKIITPVHAFMFHDSESTRTVRSDVVSSSHLPGKELSMRSREDDSESLHEICDIDYEELFTEFNVETARQACLSAEVRMRTEYCLSERRRLESECEKQAVHVDELNTLKQKNVALEDEKKSLSGKVAELQSMVSVKDCELKDVDVIVTSLKSQNNGLADQVRVLETTCFGLCERLSEYENLTERLEEFQNAELKVVNERVEKLDADLAEMACHLEEKFYLHLLTTISDRRWILTHGLKLVLVKCLNSPEYLTALGAAISRSIEKGMQDGLAVGIDYGRAVRSLADIVAYNPSVEADFNSALQELREVDFRLLADLKSHKDASIEDVMNLLRLESPFADAPGIDSLQPDIEQLKVTIYRSEDQVVLGETSLSFSLSVSHSRVERIRANITAERSALLGVWTPLSEPLPVLNLVGTSSTSISVPAINRYYNDLIHHLCFRQLHPSHFR
ncbi:hypothetical protein Tco_0521937 [Tanacetum coccineum]